MFRNPLPCTAVALALALTACADAPDPVAPDLASASAPGVAASAQPIPDQYIVVFRPGVVDVPGLARRLGASHRGEVRHIYENALEGFAVRVPAQAAAALARNPNVLYVEADQVMQAVGTQTNATWGLDRIDQVNLPLSTSYTYPNTGTGVTAYILDTGILYAHADFGGRATFGFDAFGGNGNDCNGHGSHVAGTVGGSTYGAAKGVALKAVRVLDCNGSGSTSGVIAGIDWVTGHHAAGAAAVANMSLGGGFSQSLNDAVTASINDGVPYALSAGNGDRRGRPLDACGSSPASTPTGITVGATDKTDKEASFSNYGTCVDMLAPGVGITSAWYTSNTATNTISGTSMAAPHVAGAAALYIAANPGSSPAAVASALVGNAGSNKIALHSRSTSGGTPNKLLYMGFIGGGGGEPTNTPPTAAFTFTCTDLACSFDGSGSTDSDGSIAGYAWNFGDGSTGSGQNVSRTYAAGGTYTVTLTVTDNDGATGGTSQSVAVSSSSSGGGGGITLSAQGYKVKGLQKADLTWNGASSGLDIYRNDAKIVTNTANDSPYTDNIDQRGGGTYRYVVCHTGGTSTCSNEATVVF